MYLLRRCLVLITLAIAGCAHEASRSDFAEMRLTEASLSPARPFPNRGGRSQRGLFA
jgi:hypothetical protein